MMFPASRIRRRRADFAAVASLAAAAVLGLGAFSAWAAEAAASSSEAAMAPPSAEAARVADPFAGHFPNSVLRTHEGRNVRFYDDLLKGKIVMINFMYATCTER